MYLEGLETERILFRALTEEDFTEWGVFFCNNPSLPYLGLDLTLTTQKHSEEWIEIQLKRYEDQRYGHHALIEKESGKLIGQCGLLTQDLNGVKEIEVGYHILPEYWGKGFATEAALMVKKYAIEQASISSLISVIDIRNTASQNVAKKLGMTIDYQTRVFELDVYIYRVTL